jgi:hypothetical protein
MAVNIYRNALDVQDASNLSGVVYQFARDMKVICEEVRASGGVTEDVNRHAVCRLYAEQIAHLSGAGVTSDSKSYRQAYDICHAKAEKQDAAAC